MRHSFNKSREGYITPLHVLWGDIMKIKQKLEYNKGHITLNQIINDDDLEKENYERRKIINPKGFSHLGRMREVCQIDEFLFSINKWLIAYRAAKNFGNEKEARMFLNKFLQENPQYRTGGGSV